jgi:putative ABC transport system ATP-binding protein
MPVQIRDLTIEYSSGGYRVRPIDHLDLDIDDGELVLLLGASGCGKTTLLSALAAILTPAAGTIVVNGTDVTSLSGRRLTEYRRNEVGVVFQAFNLVPSLTALENVAAPLLTGGRRAKSGARARAAELLAQVDLTDRARHRPADLSGGQQQRVAIARALCANPPLLLADEPTAHLDYVQVEGVLRLLQQLRSRDRVIVIATHDERLLPLADRVVHLSPRASATEARIERALAAHEVLFQQGDAGDYVYVVESGSIEIVRERTDGRPDVLALCQPGQYFGELAPLYGLRRSATARAVMPSRVVGYSSTEFRQLRHELADA